MIGALVLVALTAAAPEAARADLRPVEKAAASAVSDATMPSRLVISGALLRASDIALGAPDLALLQLPDAGAALELDEARRIQLLRNRMPGRNFALRHRGTLAVARADEPAPSRNPRRPSCYSARSDLPAGTYIVRADVNEVDCSAARGDARLRYDAAARAPYARDQVAAGSYLGALRLDADRPVAQGTAMLLRTRVGPVTIEREVVSIQAGRGGKRLFVRAEDGAAFASRLADQVPEERP